jgi:hypothetical protein
VPHNSIKLALATLAAMVATNACTAAQLGVWEEDLRRCMIYKPIDGGRVAVANDEGAIEIEVQGERAATDGAQPIKYMVTFDSRPPIDATPEGSTLDNKLGSYAAIAPIFAKAQNMTISITAPNAPARAVTIQIGDGAKAMGFLKKCEDYWRRRNAKHR